MAEKFGSNRSKKRQIITGDITRAFSHLKIWRIKQFCVMGERKWTHLRTWWSGWRQRWCRGPRGPSRSSCRWRTRRTWRWRPASSVCKCRLCSWPRRAETRALSPDMHTNLGVVRQQKFSKCKWSKKSNFNRVLNFRKMSETLQNEQYLMVRKTKIFFEKQATSFVQSKHKTVS